MKHELVKAKYGPDWVVYWGEYLQFDFYFDTKEQAEAFIARGCKFEVAQ